MFAFLRGILESKTKNTVVIDVSGVGYRLLIPFSTYAELPDIGAEIKLNTYMAVREDDVSLYGFLSKEELRVFELVISVSGIGPKIGIGILSDISPAEFSLAVISDDVERLTKISGIGKKTAQRIIIELKDKLKAEGTDDNIDMKSVKRISGNSFEEAIDALLVLGYSAKDAANMVSKVAREDMNTSEIIKAALKN